MKIVIMKVFQYKVHCGKIKNIKKLSQKDKALHLNSIQYYYYGIGVGQSNRKTLRYKTDLGGSTRGEIRRIKLCKISLFYQYDKLNIYYITHSTIKSNDQMLTDTGNDLGSVRTPGMLFNRWEMRT